ncbi:MAG: serine hydrolase, partial [Verrucomicrobia bacterium]|nr:serine hydrolase [Verrucomicrobiota bacterium]
MLLAAQISAQDMQPLAAREELPSVAQIESFFDGLMAGQMNAHRVPGGVVALVARDRLVLAKGYGFADVAARTPVKPET